MYFLLKSGYSIAMLVYQRVLASIHGEYIEIARPRRWEIILTLGVVRLLSRFRLKTISIFLVVFFFFLEGYQRELEWSRDVNRCQVLVSNISDFQPYLGKGSNLTHIFQMTTRMWLGITWLFNLLGQYLKFPTRRYVIFFSFRLGPVVSRWVKRGWIKKQKAYIIIRKPLHLHSCVIFLPAVLHNPVNKKRVFSPSLPGFHSASPKWIKMVDFYILQIHGESQENMRQQTAWSRWSNLGEFCGPTNRPCVLAGSSLNS